MHELVLKFIFEIPFLSANVISKKIKIFYLDACNYLSKDKIVQIKSLCTHTFKYARINFEICEKFKICEKFEIIKNSKFDTIRKDVYGYRAVERAQRLKESRNPKADTQT